jgi:hypothetical protein
MRSKRSEAPASVLVQPYVSAAKLLDLGETGPAILTVDQADDGGHGQTPLTDHGGTMHSELFPADVVASQNGFHV